MTTAVLKRTDPVEGPIRQDDGTIAFMVGAETPELHIGDSVLLGTMRLRVAVKAYLPDGALVYSCVNDPLSLREKLQGIAAFCWGKNA